MLAIAAARLGYRCHVLDPPEPAARRGSRGRIHRAAYDDCDALERFADAVDVATYEFENIPVAPLAVLGAKLRPGTRSLEIAQDRAGEKRSSSAAARASPRGARSTSLADVDAAVAELGTAGRAQDPALRL